MENVSSFPVRDTPHHPESVPGLFRNVGLYQHFFYKLLLLETYNSSLKFQQP